MQLSIVLQAFPLVHIGPDIFLKICLSNIRSLFLSFDARVTVHRDKFLIINQLDILISQIYFRNETLHVSDSSSVYHQEFFTVHTAMVYVIQVC